ncbi:MAG TPA: adenylate kinase [Dehalococcoidia bacterium]
MTSAPPPGRRICVIGTSGAGKTFVAEALAEKLGLTYICNDAVIWRPNWQPAPRDKVYGELEAATRAEGWTFDGNLSSPDLTRRPEDALVLERCDTLVWLDLPRWQVHGQVIRRTVGRLLSQEPLWHGNRESLRTLLWRESIIWWSIRSFGRRRRDYAALFRDPQQAHRRLIRLRSRREVDAWLPSLPAPSL